MKYAVLGLVGLLSLSACAEALNFANKYDPDGTLRCMGLDLVRQHAAEAGVTIDDWVKTEKIAVCATVQSGDVKAVDVQ